MLASPEVTEAFAQTAFTGALHPHQTQALEAFGAAREAGRSRWCLELAPGTGKTIIALEIVRRLGRPALILCPNAAVQSQWLAAWHRFAPATVAATGGRVLWTPITVLTARALAVFDAESEVDEEGRPSAPADAEDPGEDDLPGAVLGAEPGPTLTGSLTGLPQHGRELAQRLGAGGPWTIVLDEVSHLLDVWGADLLPDLLEHLGSDTALIGLTAGPVDASLTDLFGRIDPAPSVPACVRAGVLAPYQELAHLARPTPAERDWLVADSAGFTELCTQLLSSDFATLGFLAWLHRRFLHPYAPAGGAAAANEPWHRFAQAQPALAVAALRLHHIGLLERPPGALLFPQHRHAPTSIDWLVLVADYAEGALAGSTDPRDAAAYGAITTVLPAVGQPRGRDGEGEPQLGAPALRVLARSAGKTAAVGAILGVEQAELGERLRALVLCDHERAGSPLPDRLAGVLHPHAGSAMLTLEHLVGLPTTAALDPVLVTGRTVACGRATGVRLRSWLREAEPGLDLALLPMRDGPQGGARGSDVELVHLHGRGWAPRRWVPLLTRFFEDGGTRVLVGTRSLLGEGWDIPRLNVVVDLTCNRSPTAIAQTRGRAARLDPGWPEKVATIWTVAVISDEHPAGGVDYDRFAATHDELLAPDADGAVVPGVAHVDRALDDFVVPAVSELPEIQARIDARVARAGVLAAWRVGTACLDAMVPTVHVQPTLDAEPFGAAEPLAAVPLGRGAGAGAGAADLAAAVAEALHAAGLIPTERVETVDAADGSCSLVLGDGSPADAGRFADALVEVLGPLENPAYVVSRRVLLWPNSPVAALRDGLARRLGLPRRTTLVWHAVPEVLCAAADACAFLEFWQRHAGGARLLSTTEAEGAATVAAQGVYNPTGAASVQRTRWG